MNKGLAGSLGLIIMGVITFVFGYALAPTILSSAATAGASANIGSFSGAQGVNDLGPLLYYTMLIVIVLGFVTVGGVGVRRTTRG